MAQIEGFIAVIRWEETGEPKENPLVWSLDHKSSHVPWPSIKPRSHRREDRMITTGPAGQRNGKKNWRDIHFQSHRLLPRSECAVGARTHINCLKVAHYQLDVKTKTTTATMPISPRLIHKSLQLSSRKILNDVCFVDCVHCVLKKKPR